MEEVAERMPREGEQRSVHARGIEHKQEEGVKGEMRLETYFYATKFVQNKKREIA